MRPGFETSDTRLARALSRLLLCGLSLAVALLIVGAILAVARTGTPLARTSSFGDIPRGLAHLQPDGFFDLGLVVLLLTPAARVLALLFAFAWRRVWLFAGLAVVVLAVLATSAYLGLRPG